MTKQTGMKYSELVERYPAFEKLFDRLNTLLDEGISEDDLLPDAYAWVEKKMDREHRAVARAKLEQFCRAKREAAQSRQAEE